jgi:hypothetical protein
MRIYTFSHLKNYEDLHLCDKAVWGWLPNYRKCDKLASHHNPFQPILHTCDKSAGCELSAAPRCFLLSTWSTSCIRQLCNMLGQRQRTVINLVILVFFFLFWDRNHIIANLILLESRAVQDIKACFKMEKIFMLCLMKYVWWMFRNLWWILYFAAEFDACVNKFSCLTLG